MSQASSQVVGERLDDKVLIAEAESKTGLADWGGDEFREPLAILVESAENEAQLSPLRRERLRRWPALRLEYRLRMIQDRRDRPEIARQVIERPVFQMGMPRAGTTYLHGCNCNLPSLRLGSSLQETFRIRKISYS